MTPLDFIASLPHGEAKAAALTVYNLMTQTENEELEEINELDWLDYVIDTLLEAHCNDTDC